MAIMAMFVVFAVPRTRDKLDMNLKKQARMLSGSIRFLYDQAAVKNKIYRLHYDLENQEYWVEKSEEKKLPSSNEHDNRDKKPKESKWDEDKDLLKKHVKLEKHLKFRDIKTPQSKDPVTSGEAYTHFFPSGLTEETQIRLESDTGHVYTIVVNPLTGAAKIYSYDIEEKR